jgi:aryl-alcohol dehydrogenase-like predicted oxidoreductase
MSQEKADRLLPLLLDNGVNHIDTAASYGESELRLAPWLATRRNDFFLATKTGERTGDGARRELETSLDRLGVDQVDLVQLHNLVEPDEWETAHGPGGAVAALAKARDEGLVKHIGVTGHGTRIAGMHLRSLKRFPYDSVLLPYNLLMLDNPAYRHDVTALLERCAADQVAVQTIKAVARRRWAEDPFSHYSWYEPLTDSDAIDRAVRYVLSNDQLFLNTTSDARLLPQVLAVAGGSLATPDEAAMRRDVDAHGMKALFDGAALERI